MKKKLIFIFLAVIIAVAGYLAFNVYKYKEFKTLSDKYIVNGEFEKAEKALKEAVKYDFMGSNKDNITIRALGNFQEARIYFDQKRYSEANETVSKIDEKKLNNLKLASDTINLKKQISDKLYTAQTFEQIAGEIQGLIDAEDFKGANNKYSQFSNLKLDEEQIARRNEIKAVIDEGIRRKEEEARQIAEEERRQQEEAQKAENKKKEEQALQELQAKEKEAEQKSQSQNKKLSREETRKIFLEKSQFDTTRYKVVVSSNEDITFNGDTCYLIRVTDSKDSSFKKEYYINSRTGDFTRAGNLR